MKNWLFLSLPLSHWSLSFGVHFIFFITLIFIGRNRTLDLTEIELDMAPTLQSSAVPAPPAPQEDEWRKPEAVPKILPPPPKKLDIQIPAPVAAVSVPNPAGGEGNGSGSYRSLAQVSQMPRFKVKVIPPYPAAANHANIEGIVILKVDIDESGAVKKVDLIQGLGYGCDESAIAAVQRSSFTPAYAGGVPVPVRITIPYHFGFNLPEDKSQ